MILIVEDEPINCFVLNSYLDKMNYKTVIANNGQEAIGCLKNTKEIDHILLDLNMPVMNGYDFLIALQKDSQLKYNQYKIIIISTIEIVHFRQEVNTREINIDKVIGYLQKPVDFIQLQKLLQK